MDAPFYPPSQAFEPPIYLPERMAARQTSIKRVVAHPDACAIALKEMPALAMVAQSPDAAPFLDNVSLKLVVELRLSDEAALDRIEEAFSKLGAE